MTARTTLAQAFPLFGLRLRTERLELRLPTDDELLQLMDVARSGIHPPDEMPFGVAWSTIPSPAFERGYLAYHWANRSGWSSDDWELGLAVWLDCRPIGMQGMHARRFAALRTVGTGSWLARDVQGQGYGKEMRAAMLTLAFNGLGALVAETEAFTDNAASAGVSRALGYEENGTGGLAPEGVLRETQRFRMTVERWRSRSRPPVQIDGLEACREMFGA
jgi:RimJ/RimL family protein N-acetyltransferase